MAATGICQPCSGDFGPLGRAEPVHCYGKADRPAPPGGMFGGWRCNCPCRDWPDDTDMTPAEFDALLAAGEPVEVVTVKPAKEKRMSTAVRLPESLLVRLDMECDARCVGRNLIVTRAIEFYLDNLPPLEPR